MTPAPEVAQPGATPPHLPTHTATHHARTNNKVTNARRGWGPTCSSARTWRGKGRPGFSHDFYAAADTPGEAKLSLLGAPPASGSPCWASARCEATASASARPAGPDAECVTGCSGGLVGALGVNALPHFIMRPPIQIIDSETAALVLNG